MGKAPKNAGTRFVIRAAGWLCRTNYRLARWTATAGPSHVFVLPEASQEEKAAAEEKLRVHAADCIRRVSDKQLRTEVGWLSDVSWRVETERLASGSVSLLIEISYATRNLRQWIARVFWLPTRGWPTADALLTEALWLFGRELFRDFALNAKQVAGGSTKGQVNPER